MTEPMHIERIEVENFKRLRTVDISTDGDVITIGGKNAQGKSSLQDAIWNTIGGKQKAVTEPVRAGERKASSTITLSRPDGTGLVATRTWKPNGQSTLTLKAKGGKMNLDQPQTRLNDLLGPFMFDPMEFANMEPKKRRDALVELVGVDVTEFDDEIARLTQERLLTGRDKKRVQGALDEAEPPASGLPAEFVSVTALSEQIGNVDRVGRRIGDAQERREEIALQIERLQAEDVELLEKQAKGSQWLATQPRLEDLKEQFENAESTNQAIHAAAEYRRLAGELEGYETAYEEGTAAIRAAEQAKADLLASANLPLEGLTFDDEGVFYNGVPFGQASSAERIRVSVAMAVAHNPELRVVSVKDASLMDEDSLALLKQIAAEHGVQLFLEVVGSDESTTVVLEDGEVVS